MTIIYIILISLIIYLLYILFKPTKKEPKKEKQKDKERTIVVYPNGRIDFPDWPKPDFKPSSKDPPLKEGYKRIYLKNRFVDYKPPERSRGNPLDDMLASMYDEAMEKRKKTKKQTRNNRKVPSNYKCSRLELNVAGIFYRKNKAKKVARALKIGDPVYLIMEPYNIHDDFAVKIIAKNEHIGYIPSFYSKRVTYGIMSGGYYASVSHKKVYIHKYFGDEMIEIEIYLIPINEKSDD